MLTKPNWVATVLRLHNLCSVAPGVATVKAARPTKVIPRRTPTGVPRLRLVPLVLVSMFLLSRSVFAGVKEWTGAVSHVWSKPENWVGGTPETGDHLSFPAAAVRFSAVNDLGPGTMFVGAQKASPILVVLVATFMGFCYGTNLSLLPSLTKDKWGLKNFGINYGLVFTAWGVGGFVMGRLSQMLIASTGKYTSSFLTAAALLVVGAVIAVFLKGKKSEPQAAAQK